MSATKKLRTDVVAELPSGPTGPARFKQVKILGEGTFGVVFLALDLKRDGTKVAVKRIKPAEFIDGVHWTSLREIKILQVCLTFLTTTTTAIALTSREQNTRKSLTIIL